MRHFILGALSLLLTQTLPGETTSEEAWVQGTLETTHFVVRHQSRYAPGGLAITLETLHAKLMRDLSGVAAWSEGERIRLDLYSDAASAQQFSGLPVWAGGWANTAAHSIVTFESPQFTRTMAHELAHLYLTGYFLQITTAPVPLWLNEGVATAMERDDHQPGEDQQTLQFLKHLPPQPLETLLSFDYREDRASTEEVALWYLRAGSLVRFLLGQPRGRFTDFCDALRHGAATDDALRQAFGLALGNRRLLEERWLEQIR